MISNHRLTESTLQNVMRLMKELHAELRPRKRHKPNPNPDIAEILANLHH